MKIHDQHTLVMQRALILAFESKQPRMEELLLENLMVLGEMAGINTQDRHGRTLLMLAAQKCPYSAVAQIIRLGGNLYLADREGRRAVDYALEREEPNFAISQALDIPETPNTSLCLPVVQLFKSISKSR